MWFPVYQLPLHFLEKVDAAIEAVIINAKDAQDCGFYGLKC